MATNTRLVTFNAQNVTPQDDGLLYETAIPQTGIIYGANLTANGTNTVHIETGFGIVRGRFFEIFESDIAIPLSSSGEIQGRIIGRLDLSNVDEPFVILAQTGTLAPLREDADVNIFNGVHEFLLATFMVNETTISGFIDVKPYVTSSNVYVEERPAVGQKGVIYMVQKDANRAIPWIYVTSPIRRWVQLSDDYAQRVNTVLAGVPTTPDISNVFTDTSQIVNAKFVAKSFQERIKPKLTIADIRHTAVDGVQDNTYFSSDDDEYRNGYAIGTMMVRFSANSNGRRYAAMSVRGPGSSGTRGCGSQVNFAAAREGQTQLMLPFVTTLNAGDSLGVEIFQNSGSNLSCVITVRYILFLID